MSSKCSNYGASDVGALPEDPLAWNIFGGKRVSRQERSHLLPKPQSKTWVLVFEVHSPCIGSGHGARCARNLLASGSGYVSGLERGSSAKFHCKSGAANYVIVNACARRLGSRAGGPRRVRLKSPKTAKFARFWSTPSVEAADRRDRGGGGGPSQNFASGEGLGRRPDPGLLVPDASRQEAEANYLLALRFAPCSWS